MERRRASRSREVLEAQALKEASALQSCGFWPAFREVAEPEGKRLVLAHPQRVKAIASAKLKHDPFSPPSIGPPLVRFRTKNLNSGRPPVPQRTGLAVISPICKLLEAAALGPGRVLSLR